MIEASAGRHVFVAGTHRSGSTFTASMLALAPGTAPVFESLSPIHPDKTKVHFEYFFQYVGPENEERYLPVRDYWRAITGARLVVKEPTGTFAAEWMADRAGMTPVITIRHPAAFVGSTRRLGGRYQVEDLLNQPLLMKRYLAALEEELRNAAGVEDQVVQQSLLWKAVYSVVSDLCERRRDWCFVRHEDLSRRPLEEFGRLYTRLGLRMTEEVRAGIRQHTERTGPYDAPAIDDIRRRSAAHLRDWEKLLSRDEVDRVRQITGPVAERFYGPEDW